MKYLNTDERHRKLNSLRKTVEVGNLTDDGDIMNTADFEDLLGTITDEVIGDGMKLGEVGFRNIINQLIALAKQPSK